MTKVHGYVWLAAVTFFIFGLAYIFLFNHDEMVDLDLDPDLSESWRKEFLKNGLTDEQISKISRTRDSSTGMGVWRYDRKSTCVTYGDFEKDCEMSEGVCAGSDLGKGRTTGSMAEQAKEVSSAILGGGVHRKCPLLY